MNLLESLETLVARLDREQVEYALCGGLAMAVYQFPRSTLDIDVMIDPQDLEKAKSIAADMGFTLDTGLMGFKDGDVSIYRVVRIDRDGGEPLVLDFLLVSEATRDAWQSRTKVKWDRGEISVVSPVGLIELKSMRKSGQDEDDIAHLKGLVDEA